MALSYDEMQQLFEQMGFKGFSMRPYDAQMEYLISEAMEDNAKAYMIDVVPGDLEFGQNDGIALLDWKSIVSYFSITSGTVICLSRVTVNPPPKRNA